jgi:hypothetical protein
MYVGRCSRRFAVDVVFVYLFLICVVIAMLVALAYGSVALWRFCVTVFTIAGVGFIVAGNVMDQQYSGYVFGLGNLVWALICRGAMWYYSQLPAWRKTPYQDNTSTSE